MSSNSTVVIGIDPHKSSHTAVAIDEREQVLDELRIVANARQVERLLMFASTWPDHVWGVEGAGGVGRLVAQQLVARGEHVVDVPATLAARVRVLGGRSARKTDAADARSIAVAALRTPTCRPVAREDHTVVLKLLADRFGQVARTRTQTMSRLHNHLRHLRPGGAKRSLSAIQAAKVLRTIRPVTAVDAERKRVARELLDDVRRYDRQLKGLRRRIDDALELVDTSLLDIVGIGPIIAAQIIAIVGDVRRFPDRGHFASYAGVAPVEASSGDTRRHRLNRRGNRQLNHLLHMIATTQIRTGGPGRDYYDRKLGEGKTPAEARRALKRVLADVVYRHLVDDDRRRRNEWAQEDTSTRS